MYVYTYIPTFKKRGGIMLFDRVENTKIQEHEL